MSEVVDATSLLVSFQRDLNRVSDSDRTTRKRGLLKLLEEVPWGKKSQRAALKVFVSENLLKVLIPAIADELEKCRETTLQILKKSLEKCDDISATHLHELTAALCARVAEVPFAEPAEEIRLLVVELLLMIKKHPSLGSSALVDADAKQMLTAIDERMVQTLIKALTDGFPSVKRTGAELLIDISTTSPVIVKSYFKQLLKALSANSAHQHSKTRAITLQAIGRGLCCVGLEEYQTLLKDPILAILLRTVSDRTASVRMELGQVCTSVFTHRVQQCLQRGSSLVAEDFELFVVLLLLHGDAIEEVAADGKRQLLRAVQPWSSVLLSPVGENEGEVDVPIHHSGMDVEDGEQALKAAAAAGAPQTAEHVEPPASAAAVDDTSVEKLVEFLSSNLSSLMPILHEGVESWTTDSRKRYLRALHGQITYTDARLSSVLPRLLSLLAHTVRDEDTDVRSAAEECGVRLGAQAVPEEVLDILLPRVAGAVAGGDTATQRANAVGVLTHVLRGMRQGAAANAPYICTTVASTLTDTSLYAYREASLREALLLLVRVFPECYAEECQTSTHLQQALLLALLFLCGKCPGEDDVVSDVAHRELRRLSAICAHTDDSGALLGAHFAYLLHGVVTFQLSASQQLTTKLDLTDSKNLSRLAQYLETLDLGWESDSPAMAAFSVLLREAPFAAWSHHALVLPVVKKMVQPKPGPAPGSMEANMQSYAAQRGEDMPNQNIGLVDARLQLLALVEGMVRAGTANWECSQHIAAASATIIRHMIVPNLVWRVGRVEATVRKVALALCYGILKAGAVPTETLFSTAAELVPLIVSHLDDSEVTPRQMACLCVTVLFERLRGVFSEQSIHEIYPKLVARLDDSNDQVRIAICGALIMFFQCGAHPRCFSSTTIDYTLDQLFIHLDDPDPKIQQAVLGAIVQAATSLDKDAVLKKAEKNRSCHRTPTMCDKVVFEVTGVELLED